MNNDSVGRAVRSGCDADNRKTALEISWKSLDAAAAIRGEADECVRLPSALCNDVACCVHMDESAVTACPSLVIAVFTDRNRSLASKLESVTVGSFGHIGAC